MVGYDDKRDRILFHKDKTVALLSFSEDGSFNKVIRVNDKEYLPLPAKKDISQLREWIEDRAVPSTRHGVDSLLKDLNVKKTGDYMLDNLGLSLTDSYWICPIALDVRWKDVNLYDNDFSSAIIGSDHSYKQNIPKQTKFSKYSPDATLKGDLKKKWLIKEDGTRILVKGNFGVGCQQSVNEKFVSLINSKQNKMPFVNYDTMEFSFDNQPAICCVSDNFITSDKTEFICAYDIAQSVKIRGDKSPYYQFLEGCEKLHLDIDKVRDFLAYQIMLDFLVTNPDRHFNNFGIIRDTETLEGISIAPLYDTGSCLFWNVSNPILTPSMFEHMETHSFLKKETNLLRYVKDPDILDLSKLPSEDEMYRVYAENNVFSEERIAFIMEAFAYKKKQIERLQFDKERKTLYAPTHLHMPRKCENMIRQSRQFRKLEKSKELER